jgi:predicted enzyme related to lactoylglutathione lyase
MGERAVVHIEIPAKNRLAAGKFYQDMFGWEYTHTDEPMPYTSFRAPNTGGGFPELDNGYQPGAVLIYVSSEDIEADLKKAESLGGKVVGPKMEIPGVGWMGVFTDPTGNKIALWKGMMQSG